MKKQLVVLSAMMMLVLCTRATLADRIIPRDKFPMYNSEWNLNNTGIYFTDGEYFFVNGGDGRIYRLDDQLQLDVDIFNSDVRGVSRITYLEDEHKLYFLADRVGKNKEGGLYRVSFRDGVVTSDVELLVKGAVANYAINDKYICYNVSGYNGVFRIDHDGNNKQRLSRHEIQQKNPAVRMHIEDGILYYINMKDHYLWSVPVEAQDDQQASVFIDRPMHYYVKVPYLRADATSAEEVFIYVEYAENTSKLDKAHLAAVDCNGERVHELDYLREIQSRYINYYQGILYYIDSSVEPQRPRWINLTSNGTEQGSIHIAGQGDLEAFKASDGTHWKFNNRVGYIHVFDGWLVMSELGENFTYYNPRTGRSDVTGGAGTDIWFVNLETLTSYRCKMNN